MILEREQWHLGYASLLRDCRSGSRYPQANNHDKDDGNDSNDDNLQGPTMGRALLLIAPTADALSACRILCYMLRADGVPYQCRVCLGWERLRRAMRSGRSTDDLGSGIVRAVVLVEMGATRNLTTLGSSLDVKCYVFDSHRPYHLANVHSGKNVVLFNDRPLTIGGQDGEIPSDGDDLSGADDLESTSSEEESQEESDIDNDDTQEQRNDEEEEDEDGEHEFESDSEPRQDYSEKTNKRQKTERQRTEDDLHASDEENSDDDNNKVANPLDTTAVTADLTMTQDDDDDPVPTNSTQRSFRELHRLRRNRIRLHYSSGSYHASPSSWMTYTLCSQLRFGNVADLLWLACVGVTDAYIHGRLDVSGYSALSVDLKRHVARLFPNEMVDRVGKAVFAEELEDLNYSQADVAAGGGHRYHSTLTQIGLSENGRILSQSEYKFMLLRHTSLWDSMLHSNFVASKLQVWRGEGRQKLMELLAKMGFPLESCRQPWALVDANLRRRLRESIDDCAEEYGLDNVSYTGFVRVTGYKSLLSASDMVHAVTALLKCSPSAVHGIGSQEDDDIDESVNEEEREDKEIIEAFNAAFDALNSNTSIDGSVEGSNLSNLVNGGSMTGTTGLGAGIRLAMTIQKIVMFTARNLVDRNAIICLSHFRYAYLNCTSNSGSGATATSAIVTPDISNKDGEPTSSRKQQFHIFAKPLILSKLAQFLMDMHRVNGKWTGGKARPLVLLAEKPRAGTYMVVGYEYPEEAGNVVRNKFGQNFQLAARTMKGTFWFDSFDSNAVEVARKDVQRFIEQLHYMMESL